MSKSTKTPTKPARGAGMSPPSPAGGGVGGEGATSATPEPITTHLLIRANRDGFRRAARPWTAAPTLVEIGEFDEAQVLALLAEPMLDVVAMTAEAAAAWTAEQA